MIINVHIWTLIFLAFCKNPADEKWYVYDDTQVKETNEDQIVTRAAYLLFYQRRSVHSSAAQNHNWIFNLVKNFNYKQLKYKPPARMNQSHDELLDSNYGNDAKLCLILPWIS